MDEDGKPNQKVTLNMIEQVKTINLDLATKMKLAFDKCKSEGNSINIIIMYIILLRYIHFYRFF